MFHLGFLKTASLTSHNDGTEFKVQDTDPAPYAPGAGGMAPSGIPSYQPTGGGALVSKDKSQLGTKAAEKKRALDIAMLSKLADGLDYVGTQGEGAETLASQLKYETGYNNITENMGYNKIKQDKPISPLLRRVKKVIKGAER